MNNKHKSQILKAFICAFTLTAILAGCAQGMPSDDNNSTAPKDANYDYTGYEDYSEAGLGITLKLPSKYIDDETLIPGKYEVMFGDLSLLDAPKAETDPSDHLDLFFMPQKGEYILFRVLAYPEAKWDSWMDSGKKGTDITKNAVTEELCRKDGLVYIYDQPENDTSGFDANMKTAYGELTKMLPAIKASIKTITAEAGDLGAFTATDVNGNAIDNTIFEGHKLTMINIWATFCQPCIKEMPNLEKMSKDMPDGTQLISIVGDVADDETLKLAKEIADETGISFTSVVPDDMLKKYLDENMVAYPTTLFVDSAGKIIGEPIIGERELSVYQEVLNNRLAQVGS